LHEDTITPKENRLVIFPSATYHFVENFKGERTSLLVNPWSKRVHEQQMPTYPKWRKQ